MQLLTNPMSPLKPYALAIKLAGAAILLSALVALIWSWDSRGNKIDSLESTQATIVNAVTLATVAPDEDGKRKLLKVEDVPAAIAALSNSLKSADAALSAISSGTLTAKAASDAADKALARDLDRMQQRDRDRNLDEFDPWGDGT